MTGGTLADLKLVSEIHVVHQCSDSAAFILFGSRKKLCQPVIKPREQTEEQ